MRFKFHLLTAFLFGSLLFIEPFSSTTTRAGQEKKLATSPAAGTFRVILTGFSVNHESDDDIFEGDGKRDEVYLRAEIFLLNQSGGVTLRRSLRSIVMGDTNNQSDPPRMTAGSASSTGGLRSSDPWPNSEPWHRVSNPSLDRPPLLLWEGSLTQGNNMIVIVPTVWEWDSRDPSPTEIEWERLVNDWFQNGNYGFVSAIRRNERSPELYINPILFHGGPQGTRPVGIDRTANGVLLRVRSLTLTYEAALQIATTTPSNLGYGVIALNYVDAQDHGDYTLYLQVEQTSKS